MLNRPILTQFVQRILQWAGHCFGRMVKHGFAQEGLTWTVSTLDAAKFIGDAGSTLLMSTPPQVKD